MNKIENTRDKKKEEIQSLRKKGKTLYSDLLPEVLPLYDDIKDSLYSYVQNLSISESDLNDEAARKAFSEKLSKDFNYEMECQLNIQIERLYHIVQNRLGQDVDELKIFGDEFNTNMNEIQLNIQTAAMTNSGDENSLVTSTLIDTAAIVAMGFVTGAALPGIGGIICGYREQGIKGAVVGGASGVAIGTAAALGLIALGVGGLPMALVGGLTASFGGRSITRLVFGRKQQQLPDPAVYIEKIKGNIFDSIDNDIMQLRNSAAIEKWLKNTCDELYNKIADDIDREWENSLVTMERNLSQIRLDLQMNEDNRKKTEEDLNEYAAVIKSVVESITPIYNKLNVALNYGE